jgi:hypothetical protein
MTADAPRNESRAATEHCHRPERMSPACRRVNMIMMIGPDGPSWTWIATVPNSVPNRVPRANLLMKGSGAGEPYRRMRVMRLERGWPAEREGAPGRRGTHDLLDNVLRRALSNRLGWALHVFQP